MREWLLDEELLVNGPAYKMQCKPIKSGYIQGPFYCEVLAELDRGRPYQKPHWRRKEIVEQRFLRGLFPSDHSVCATEQHQKRTVWHFQIVFICGTVIQSGKNIGDDYKWSHGSERSCLFDVASCLLSRRDFQCFKETASVHCWLSLNMIVSMLAGALTHRQTYAGTFTHNTHTHTHTHCTEDAHTHTHSLSLSLNTRARAPTDCLNLNSPHNIWHPTIGLYTHS